MTKQEARRNLSAGFKIKHQTFVDGDYININELGQLVDKKGQKRNESLFWFIRTHKDFDTGWEIVL